jgi:hypothetical protein
VRNYVWTPEEKWDTKWYWNLYIFIFCYTINLSYRNLLVHSSNGRKYLWLRESHTSYKIVECVSQPVNYSRVFWLKVNTLRKVPLYTSGVEWLNLRCMYLIYLYNNTNMVQVHWLESGIRIKTCLCMELHILINMFQPSGRCWIFMWLSTFIQHDYYLFNSMWNYSYY